MAVNQSQRYSERAQELALTAQAMKQDARAGYIKKNKQLDGALALIEEAVKLVGLSSQNEESDGPGGA